MAGGRTLKVEPMKAAGMDNCVRVTARSGGRKTGWTVCSVGAIGEAAGLSVNRRRVLKKRGFTQQGGITACSAQGKQSSCVRAKYGVVLFPGGGTKLRKKGVPVYAGIKRRRKSRRKGRR